VPEVQDQLEIADQAVAVIALMWDPPSFTRIAPARRSNAEARSFIEDVEVANSL